MASDGVWDNMFESDVKDCIKQQMPRKRSSGVEIAKLSNLDDAADCIGTKAERLGNKENYWSPFAKEAMKYFKDF